MEEWNDNPPFFRLPQGLVKKYGWNVAGIYSVLLECCTSPIYEVAITHAKISDMCGMPVMTVRRTIAKLENVGLIERIATVRNVNVYKVVPIVHDRVHQQSDSDDEPKQLYGQYQHVLLSATEYQALVQEFGDYKIKKYIQKVDDYCQQNGKLYSDYAFTIRKWIKEDQEIQQSDSHHFTEEELAGYLRLVNRFRDDD